MALKAFGALLKEDYFNLMVLMMIPSICI